MVRWRASVWSELNHTAEGRKVSRSNHVNATINLVKIILLAQTKINSFRNEIRDF